MKLFRLQPLGQVACAWRILLGTPSCRKPRFRATLVLSPSVMENIPQLMSFVFSFLSLQNHQQQEMEDMFGDEDEEFDKDEKVTVLRLLARWSCLDHLVAVQDGTLPQQLRKAELLRPINIASHKSLRLMDVLACGGRQKMTVIPSASQYGSDGPPGLNFSISLLCR